MTTAIQQIAATEGQSGEQALLNGEVRALHTATGFVFGGALSGVLWGLIGVATWYLAA